jgi:hypothetical protein
VEQWLATRKEAGRQIDPETAEVDWWYAQTLDPYGVDHNLPGECQQIGREYFACAPGTDVWVWFGDLPTATERALWEKHKSKLAFPAGLGIASVIEIVSTLLAAHIEDSAEETRKRAAENPPG